MYGASGLPGLPGSQKLRKLHVLLVDNDPESCEWMAQALEDGFHLRHVASASDAKSVLREYIPDILVCEVVLGQESGLDLCRYLRSIAMYDRLPVLMLTSLATLSDKIAGFEAGADDYVIKPYDVHHLAARLRLLVRLKYLQYPPNEE